MRPPVAPPTPWYDSTTPHLSHPSIIHNNNIMDTEFLVQMRQSNKCGSVRNDEIFNLHLGSGAGPWVSIPCLLQDTSHIYWFHLPKQLTRDSTPNRLNHTALALQPKPQDLATSPKMGAAIDASSPIGIALPFCILFFPQYTKHLFLPNIILRNCHHFDLSRMSCVSKLLSSLTQMLSLNLSIFCCHLLH